VTRSASGTGQRRRLAGARTRAEDVLGRGRAWIDRQEPSSRRGVAIGAWRTYRAIDGPLQSLLLSAYLLIAVVPALLVMVEYLEAHPAALASHLVDRYGLSAQTGSLLRGVLVHNRAHELATALLAIAGALFFGLGFGRVVQLVHVRAWRLTLPTVGTDQARFAAVLLGLYGLILLLLLQTSQLAGDPSWAGLVLAPGWVGVLLVYFLWAPRLLTHRLISVRDLFPGALLTALGLVMLMVLSSWVMEPWVDFYAKDYGGFGVVMAFFFWIGFGSFVIVAAASLSPALAERRDRRCASREARDAPRDEQRLPVRPTLP
jgi:membrane protein